MPVRQCTGPLPPSPWAEPGCTNLLLLGKSLAFVSLWLCFYRGLFLIYRCSSVFLLTALPGSVHIHLDRHYVGLCMTVSGVTSCKHAQAHLRLCCFRYIYTFLYPLSFAYLASIYPQSSLPPPIRLYRRLLPYPTTAKAVAIGQESGEGRSLGRPKLS